MVVRDVRRGMRVIWVVLGLRVIEVGRGGGGASPGVLLVTLMALALVWLVDVGVVVGKLVLEGPEEAVGAIPEEEREGWRAPAVDPPPRPPIEPMDEDEESEQESGEGEMEE